ncbi:MAG: DUF883 domain-containing protein [Betaproteobacteria bacterium]|nr:DUF883 domain-containing protein [Betaproteobacteria bacterium]
MTPNEKLVADFKVLMSDVDDLVRATASQSGEKLAEARSKAQQALQAARAAVARAEAAATEQAKLAAEATDQYVQDNPWTAIGIAAGVGLLIGLLVGRR